jgi:hypothetical protein
VPVDSEKLMQDKRIVAWAAWFVAPDWSLLRFDSTEHTGDDLPTDGFLCARTRFADGTGENIGGGGWIVFIETPYGLIFQSSGDQTRPDPIRYPNAKFIKDKLAPSAILHVAAEEAAQWR